MVTGWTLYRILPDAERTVRDIPRLRVGRGRAEGPQHALGRARVLPSVLVFRTAVLVGRWKDAGIFRSTDEQRANFDLPDVARDSGRSQVDLTRTSRRLQPGVFSRR